MQEFEAGQKIQYQLFDEKGKGHWFNGVIHGVRSYEDKGFIKRVTYLVDTGRHDSLIENPYDVRDREIMRQADKLLKRGTHPDHVIAKVLEKGDLPKSKIEIEVTRQPEQIELPPEHIRAV